MRKAALGFVAIVSASLALPLAAQEQAEANAQSSSQEFAIGQDRFLLSVPEGYCKPTGEFADASMQVAALDSANVTPVDLQQCGSYGQSYILIKSPLAVPRMDLTKPQFMEMLRTQMGTDAFKQAFESGLEQGKEDLANGTDGAIEVESDGITIAGSDDDCVYLRGTFQVSAPDGTFPLRVGSCMTFAGARHMVVHSYERAATGIKHETLMERSRELALTIAPLE